MKSFFSKMHYTNLPVWAGALAPLEWAYWIGAQSNNYAFDKPDADIVQVDVPVISIGNLTTGGTGKTPVIIEFSKWLWAHGKKVLILSRGYGAKNTVDYARATSPDMGDEAYLIQQKCPDAVVIVGANRSLNAQKAIREYQPDIILLDDGFQHRKLYRDFNIVLVDGLYGFGNKHLLPLGPLREPLSEINRADMVLVTKSVSGKIIERMESLVADYADKPIPVVPTPFISDELTLAMTGERFVDAKQLNEDKNILVSAIATPSRFAEDIKTLGLRFDKHCVYDDHHVYTKADAQAWFKKSERTQKQVNLLTTEKDWVKIKPLLTPEQQARTYLLQSKPVVDFSWIYFEFVIEAVREKIEAQAAKTTSISAK